ncbi:MAG: Protein kinase domain [Gammaproteobacteria bacterium]|jgi:hypothetical protein|nr:Protein kinase domain [Gammaproteobacteria bacterium]
MKIYDNELEKFVSDEGDRAAIIKALELLRNTPISNIADRPKESTSDETIILCAAVAVMPDGTIKELGPTQIQNENNWINTPTRYILFEQGGKDYIANTHTPVGRGAAGSVYSACVLPRDNQQTSQISPIVVKAANCGEEGALKHEVQFVTEDVVPHGAEGKRVWGVGNHAIAIFDYIPGQKLVKEIGAKGIVVEQALLNLNFADRCQLAIDLCTKIAAIHNQGVCHSDLNWDNVLVEIDAQGKYKAKACRIIDYGQAQRFSDKPYVAPIGKLWWNSKQANSLYGYGVAKYPLKPSAEIDIVPLGVMCDILFAAREGKDLQKCNPFQKKQEALAGVSGFRKNQTDAVVGAPFVISNDFIDHANWKLEVATADRINELMQVFFERMVSDFPEERPAAAEAIEFFKAIQSLNVLNEGIVKEANEERILSRCEELAFQTKKINENELPLMSSVLEIQPNWYAERKIDLLLRMLSYPAYLMRMDINFCKKEIDRLISLFKEEGISTNLEELTRLLGDDLIEKQTKIKCVNAVMQGILLDRKARQLEEEVKERFSRPLTFMTPWDEDDKLQLKGIDKEKLYEQLEGRDITEIIEDHTLPQIFRKHILVQEERLFLYRKKELEAARTTLQLIIGSDGTIKGVNERYSLFQFNDVGNNEASVDEVGNQADSDELVEERGSEDEHSSIDAVPSTPVPPEKKKNSNTDNQYTVALEYYKKTLEFYQRIAATMQNSNSNQDFELKDNPVCSTGQAFLRAATAAENKNKQDKIALTKLFVFQAQQLRSCFPPEDNSFPQEPQQLHDLNPTIKDCAQAINHLAKNEQRSLGDVAVAAAIAVGVLFGVAAVFTAAVALSALCLPAGLAFMSFMAPIVGPTMLTAASAAIVTLGCVVSGIGCKIEDTLQERRLAARAVNAVNAVQESVKVETDSETIPKIGKNSTSLLARIGLFGCSSKSKEGDKVSTETYSQKAAI